MANQRKANLRIVTLWLDKDDHASLKERAASEGKDVTAGLRGLIDKHLTQEKHEPKKNEDKPANQDSRCSFLPSGTWIDWIGWPQAQSLC